MRPLVAAALLALALGAAAQAPAPEAPADPVVEKRMRELGEELRCLVCQNQTIADSSAPLAVDLRNQLRTQIAQGRSDSQIRDYMVERYGDFVLYRPPMRARTVLLWAGPFLLVAIGAGIFLFMIRRRPAAAAPAPLTAERRGELQALLDGAAPQPPPAAKKKGGPNGRP